MCTWCVSIELYPLVKSKRRNCLEVSLQKDNICVQQTAIDYLSIRGLFMSIIIIFNYIMSNISS